jgi:hypothetical protein
MRLLLFILIINLISCDQDRKKDIENPIALEDKKSNQTIEFIESFLVSMNSAKSIDDSREFFYKYYYEPYEIIDGELINYYIRDFKMIWQDVQNAEPPFTKTVYNTLQGDSILDSPYALLLLKNTTCDDCVILIPKNRKEWRYEICIKNNKIYSTIGTYDLEKEEYIWYRDKKHPPMRFN